MSARMKRWMSLVVAIVAIAAVLVWQRREAGAQVLATALRIPDEIDEISQITPTDREYLRDLIRREHPAAFERSYDASETPGRRFSQVLYEELLWSGVLRALRAQGREALVEIVETARREFVFFADEV